MFEMDLSNSPAARTRSARSALVAPTTIAVRTEASPFWSKPGPLTTSEGRGDSVPSTRTGSLPPRAPLMTRESGDPLLTAFSGKSTAVVESRWQAASPSLQRTFSQHYGEEDAPILLRHASLQSKRRDDARAARHPQIRANSEGSDETSSAPIPQAGREPFGVTTRRRQQMLQAAALQRSAERAAEMALAQRLTAESGGREASPAITRHASSGSLLGLQRTPSLPLPLRESPAHSQPLYESRNSPMGDEGSSDHNSDHEMFDIE